MDVDLLRRYDGYRRRQDTLGFVSIESTDIDAGLAHPELHVQIVLAIGEKVRVCVNWPPVHRESRNGCGDPT
jgi:hypothetical protein